jgi:hypothetical protein
MRLVASSIPGEVERSAAIDALIERAVLTRMVCRELRERVDGRFSRRRTYAALGFLMWWINSLPGATKAFRASDNIDSMIVPKGCGNLLEEIRDGSKVCDALAMLQSADTESDVRNDMRIIEMELKAYWEKHGTAAR